MITEENGRRINEKGLSFSAWTVDDEEEIRRLLKMQIKNKTHQKKKSRDFRLCPLTLCILTWRNRSHGIRESRLP